MALWSKRSSGRSHAYCNQQSSVKRLISSKRRAQLPAMTSSSESANSRSESESQSVKPEEILQLLAHRQPFLLVDSCPSVEPGVCATAIKNVTFNDNFFAGHFPENPIMPGVLQIEACAQAAGICLLKGGQFSAESGTFFFSGVDSCKFKQIVQPGDILQLDVSASKVSPRWGIARFRCVASVDGETACEADISLVATSSR